MQFPSGAIYNNRVVAHNSVKEKALANFMGVKTFYSRCYPIVLIDTNYSNIEEGVDDNRRNGYEVKAITGYVQYLLDHNAPSDSIGVITPYYARVVEFKEVFEAGDIDIEVSGWSKVEKKTPSSYLWYVPIRSVMF